MRQREKTENQTPFEGQTCDMRKVFTKVNCNYNDFKKSKHNYNRGHQKQRQAAKNL